MQLVIKKDGRIRGIYGEEIDLAALGTLDIERASHVEPDSQVRWIADLSPVGGPVLGPFDRRSEALGAEVEWLERNWLGSPAILVSEPSCDVGAAKRDGEVQPDEATGSNSHPERHEEAQ